MDNSKKLIIFLIIVSIPIFFLFKKSSNKQLIIEENLKVEILRIEKKIESEKLIFKLVQEIISYCINNKNYSSATSSSGNAVPNQTQFLFGDNFRSIQVTYSFLFPRTREFVEIGDIKNLKLQLNCGLVDCENYHHISIKGLWDNRGSSGDGKLLIVTNTNKLRVFITGFGESNWEYSLNVEFNKTDYIINKLNIALDELKKIEDKVVYSNGDTYLGERLNEKLNGSGKYIWSNGDIYEGEFKDDSRHGKGRMFWSDRVIYEGDWVEDKMTGEGIITKPDFSGYEGGFLDGAFHGKGKRDFVNGDVYEGEWSNHKMHGKGKYTYSDGTIEIGEWSNGVKIKN